MSKFLQRLYKEVLDKFPFSISGYHNPDKEYEEFFHRICKFQESLDEDSKIHFTISGFAELKINSSLSEAEMDYWKTVPLKYLMFNDNYLGFSEPILSLYIYLLQHLSPEKRVVNILAENVNNGILIKICLADKIDEVHFSFIKSDNTLLIQVPKTLFKVSNDSQGKFIKDLFKTILSDKDLIVKKEGSCSSYSIDKDKVLKNKFQPIANKILDLKKVAAVANKKPENVYHKLLSEVLKNEAYKPNEIYSLVFASSILCYFYDCSLTYFVSTARVANDKRYTLGAMGIGLKASEELSDNDKALYSILVNHLASNLATQIVRDNNKHLHYSLLRSQQHQLLSDLNNDVLMQQEGMNHCDVQLSKEHIKKWNEFLKKKKTDFEKLGLDYYHEYVTQTFLKDSFTDRGVYTSIHLPKKDAVKEKNLIYGNTKSVGIKVDGNQEPIINVVLPHLFILKIKDKTNLKEHSVEFFGDKDYIFISFEFNSPISIEKFKKSLNGTRTNGSGDVGQFFIQNYEQFMIAGNVWILDENETEIVDFDRDMYLVFKEGKPASLNTDRIQDNNDYSKLIYKMQFKSIKS